MMKTGCIAVLISSVSKKVPMIEAVREALQRIESPGTLLVGADADMRCIGKYFVDRFWKMPILENLTVEQTIAYCRLHQINCVIPTRDGELSFYANHQTAFAKEGIHVMVSPIDAINICIDKLRFYETLEAMGYPAIPTACCLDPLRCSAYVVKERYGAGGNKIGINLSAEKARRYAKNLQNPVFQPYLTGKEISVDLYVTSAGSVKGVVARERKCIVNGESQVTQSIRNHALESLCQQLAEKLKFFGHVMFQLIEDQEKGTFFVLEANPRFGGASTLSIALGLDSFYWFFKEAQGDDLSQYRFERSKKEKRLIRYPKDLITT